jgi:DeoR/GlpR family transcriptional regulator of sugar metabolism
MSRNKDARQRRILIELEQSPTLRVSELARGLSVSTETIRRDLDDLTGRGPGVADLWRRHAAALRRAPGQ